MDRSTAASLADRVRAGDARALARAISLVEDGARSAAALVAALHPSGGRALVLGVTGAPGAGKSTLVDRMAALLRADGRRVGILAIDPTSPFTGGAVLGDRVRMQAHAADPDVFIRSMATRGHLGGLSRATGDAVVLLDAAGFDAILVETVGVGQDEVEIVRTADVSVVVLVPGAGDEVQALKAGVMEIADVFAVNKADREGADRTAADVEALLSFEGGASAWRPPVIKTVATTGAGVCDLLAAVERFRRESPAASAARRRMRADSRLRDAVSAGLMAAIERGTTPDEWRALVHAVEQRRLDPRAAAAQVIRRVTGRAPDALGGGEDR
jgi:LAO/AO transport system kinase